MKRHVFFLSILFFLAACTLAAEDTTVPKTEQKDKPKTAQVQQTHLSMAHDLPSAAAAPKPEPDPLEQNIADTLKMLKNEAPETYRRLQKMPTDELQKALFDAWRTGVVPVRQMPKISLPNTGTKPIPAKLTASNSIFYARLDTLSADTLKQLQNDMVESSRLASPPIGTIIDLRGAGNGDYRMVNRFAALFQPPPKAGKGKFGFHAIPLAVLVGPRTGGAAELLAALLEHSRLGITLGGTCAGTIFPMKPAVLGKRLWLVPQIQDPAWRNIPPCAYKPIIAIPETVQISPDKIGKVNLTDTDPSIRRAADLLKSLNAVRSMLR